MTWWDNRVGRNANWGDSILHPQRIWLANYEGLIGQRVLEIGYGTGKDYANIHDKVADYRGYDLTSSFQEVCLKRWPAGDFNLGDVTALPEPDCSWDLVFCRHVLEHIEDWRVALREMWRVTAKRLAILSWRELWNQPTAQKNKPTTPTNPPLHCWHFNQDEFMGALNELDGVHIQIIEFGGRAPIYVLTRGVSP